MNRGVEDGAAVSFTSRRAPLRRLAINAPLTGTLIGSILRVAVRLWRAFPVVQKPLNRRGKPGGGVSPPGFPKLTGKCARPTMWFWDRF